MKIEKIKSANVTESFIKSNSDKIYVISNFTLLPPLCKLLLRTVKYLIFEHDHKYTIDRDVSLYKDYVVPPERLINLSFYQSAYAVFCQSKLHSEVVKKNIKSTNVINLGCSIWSDEELGIIETCLKSKKKAKYAIVQSSNRIKATPKAVTLCEEKNIPYELISSPNYEE